jgi:hypothetical protein
MKMDWAAVILPRMNDCGKLRYYLELISKTHLASSLRAVLRSPSVLLGSGAFLAKSKDGEAISCKIHFLLIIHGSAVFSGQPQNLSHEYFDRLSTSFANWHEFLNLSRRRAKQRQFA